MIINKLCSSREVVEKFYSDTGIQTELINDDVQLWTLEFCDLISYPLQYLPKIIGYKQDPVYDMQNYSVPLPCNFYKLIPAGIALDGESVRWRQNAFHYLMDGECCNLEALNNSQDIFLDNFGNEFSPQVGNANSWNQNRDITFDITDNKIVFNIKTGKVCLAYLEYPVDSEGYVRIPDDTKFKRGLTSYLIWKNDYILWRQQSISDKVYQESKQNKEWGIASVSAHFKLPSVEQLQSISDSVVRLLPLPATSYFQFFKNLGERESRTSGDNYRY